MRPLRIVHIEDSDDYALLLSHVSHQCKYPTSLTRFACGSEAVRFLKDASEHEIPDLILCDLKMPGMNGHDFIQWLRQSPHKALPVIILSSSDLIVDVRTAYQLGANSFLTKPLTLREIMRLFEDTVEYWLHCNLLRRRPDL